MQRYEWMQILRHWLHLLKLRYLIEIVEISSDVTDRPSPKEKGEIFAGCVYLCVDTNYLAAKLARVIQCKKIASLLLGVVILHQEVNTCIRRWNLFISSKYYRNIRQD